MTPVVQAQQNQDFSSGGWPPQPGGAWREPWTRTICGEKRLVRKMMRRILVALHDQHQSQWEIGYDVRSAGNGFGSTASK